MILRFQIKLILKIVKIFLQMGAILDFSINTKLNILQKTIHIIHLFSLGTNYNELILVSQEKHFSFSHTVLYLAIQ